jgi:hypothetical protein
MSIRSVKELSERASAYKDYGRSFALSNDTAREILKQYRDRIPEDIRTKLAAVEDSSRDPPTHILLKPSALIRLADSLPQEDAPEKTNDQRTTANHTDVP